MADNNAGLWIVSIVAIVAVVGLITSMNTASTAVGTSSSTSPTVTLSSNDVGNANLAGQAYAQHGEYCVEQLCQTWKRYADMCPSASFYAYPSGSGCSIGYNPWDPCMHSFVETDWNDDAFWCYTRGEWLSYE